MQNERPFRVLGLQQIAIGGTDKSSLSRLWVDFLGLTPAGNFRSERDTSLLHSSRKPAAKC